MRIFRAMDASASGLTAQRLRLDVIANNLANVNTTRGPDGGPYRRQLPVFASRGGFGAPLGGAVGAAAAFLGRGTRGFAQLLAAAMAPAGAGAGVRSGPTGGDYPGAGAARMAAAGVAAGADAAVGRGVEVVAVVEDAAPPKLVYDPTHPDANGEGYVAYPNVDLVGEMVDLISATRGYEANITALNAAKQMATRALEIGRR